jgi:2,3-bisphosphoglycerate-dependent phosphoglycerate mutase
MTVFYLIRHAHADWIPDEQRPLSAKGKADALRLTDLLGIYPIAGIYSSPFKRALQTVAPLASRLGLTIYPEPDLRERTLGDAPGLYDFFASVMKTWQDATFSYPGGESNAAAQKRGVAVLQKLKEQYPGGNLALSTHGNLLALVLQHYDPSVDYPFWKALTMPDVYSLSFSKAGKLVISRLWRE